MSIEGRESVRWGLPPKFSQQRLSSTRWWPLRFFGSVIARVSAVPTETPFSWVSSFPEGRSRALK